MPRLAGVAGAAHGATAGCTTSPVRHLMEEAISIVYLNKARRPISAVTRRVIDDLQRINARLPAAQAIPVPREAALARAIARRIAQMDPWEVDRQRWGRKIADSAMHPRNAAACHRFSSGWRSITARSRLWWARRPGPSASPG